VIEYGVGEGGPKRRDRALGLWLLVLVGAAALVVAGMLRDARSAPALKES
jgi:hypothetical protein